MIFKGRRWVALKNSIDQTSVYRRNYKISPPLTPQRPPRGRRQQKKAKQGSDYRLLFTNKILSFIRLPFGRPSGGRQTDRQKPECNYSGTNLITTIVITGALQEKASALTEFTGRVQTVANLLASLGFYFKISHTACACHCRAVNKQLPGRRRSVWIMGRYNHLA